MNRYEEQAEILAVVTAKVDRYGRVGGMKKHRGRIVRILVLLEDPQSPRALMSRKL
ncbi:MAG: hypothetical protein WDA16_05850 [Candidatus Thermoplasmatota archaeon]